MLIPHCSAPMACREGDAWSWQPPHTPERCRTPGGGERRPTFCGVPKAPSASPGLGPRILHSRTFPATLRPSRLPLPRQLSRDIPSHAHLLSAPARTSRRHAAPRRRPPPPCRIRRRLLRIFLQFFRSSAVKSVPEAHALAVSCFSDHKKVFLSAEKLSPSFSYPSFQK